MTPLYYYKTKNLLSVIKSRYQSDILQSHWRYSISKFVNKRPQKSGLSN